MSIIWMLRVLFSVTAANEVVNDDVDVIAMDESESPCNTDRDCPITKFCFNDYKCLDCFNCANKNREGAPIRCARQFSECGPCLPGFLEDVGFLNTSCVPILVKGEPQQAKESAGWFGLVAVCSIALFSFASYYCIRRSISAVVASSWNQESKPPPYHEESGQLSDNGSVSYSFQLQFADHSTDHKAMAVPFQAPAYYDGGTIAFSPPIYENGSAELADNIANNAIVDAADEYDSAEPNIDIYDETTNPSAWTPGTSYTVIDEADNTENNKISPPTKKRKSDKESDCAKES